MVAETMGQVQLPIDAADQQAFMRRQGARRGVQQGRPSELALAINEIEEIERRLVMVKRRLARLSGKNIEERNVEAVEGAPPKRRAGRVVSISDVLRITMVLLGGKGTYEQVTSAARRLGDFPAKSLSSVPAKLVDQAELARIVGPGGHPSYEVVDMLKLLGKIRRSQPAFDLLKSMLRDTKGAAELLSLRLIAAYGKKTKSFLISDYVQTLRNVTDDELSKLIIATLPAILSELNAKGMVELTEGLDGLLMRGRPVSRITWRTEIAA